MLRPFYYLLEVVSDTWEAFCDETVGGRIEMLFAGVLFTIATLWAGLMIVGTIVYAITY